MEHRATSQFWQHYHALQPHIRSSAEPERYRVLNPLPPSKLDWLKQQRLRVAEVFRRFR